MSKCRTLGCRREISWFEKTAGSENYLPPMENIGEILDPDLLEKLHSYRELFALVDGELIPIRASGIYIRHRCHTEPVEPIEPELEIEEIPGTANYRRDGQVYQNYNKYKEMALSVGCPLCDAAPGESCESPNGRVRRTPHVKRYYAAETKEN